MARTGWSILRWGLMLTMAVAAGAATAATPMLSSDEMARIDQAFGAKGRAVPEESLYTIALPRNDLHMQIRGQATPIPFGFGGWVAFKRTQDGRGVTVMGDTVLLQDEVNAVMSAAQANGIEITALHNHFFWEEPRIFFMHLHGMGTDVGDLARRYSATLLPSKLHPRNQPAPATGPKPPLRFDQAELDKIIGARGAVNGPVLKYTLGRPDLAVLAMNTVITTNMGLNSWAAFAGDMDQARVAGDIAMLESEVNPVIAALRRHGLNVVAVHNHMLGEQPRIIFLHYYGTGKAADLARGFRAALDELGKRGK